MTTHQAETGARSRDADGQRNAAPENEVACRRLLSLAWSPLAAALALATL